jgi:uncharacterized protein (TIGR03118 family)
MFDRLKSVAVLCAFGTANLAAANSYLVHYLVSDVPGMADYSDPNLVNPWGLASGPNTPFWIADNRVGMSTIYDTSGRPAPVVVAVPQPGQPDLPGPTTGVIFNSSKNFLVGPVAATFVFCTAHGTIAGWNGALDPAHAFIILDNSDSGAVYTGCAMANSSNGPTLYAANFNSGRIDVFDGSMNPVKNPNAFADPLIPAGYAPFNIAVLQNRIYVSYAKQDSNKMHDVAGAGNGYIDIFDFDGNLISSFLSGGALNSPWGMTIAPPTFGDFANLLLVGNFGDGRINVYNPNTGALVGPLMDTSGNVIRLAGLWALMFGNGGRGGDSSTLYFTAGIPGPDGGGIESHGLFGSIQPPPLLQMTGIVNAANAQAGFAPNTWVSIFGNALSATTRNWRTADFTDNSLPASLDGVSASVNGEPAYLSYVSPMQVNLLLPADIPPGQAKIQFTNNGLNSGSITVAMQPQSPAFFLADGGKYVMASAVKPNDTIALWGTGFGPTTPATPNGRVISEPIGLSGALPTVMIGGMPAQVTFAGLTAAGLYQLNVVVPFGLSPGDVAVTATVNGSTTPVAMLTIAQPTSAIISGVE